MSKKTDYCILLIEDEPADALLFKRYLRDSKLASFNIQVKNRLQDGLDFLKKHEVDAILLDLSLPDSQNLEGLDQLAFLHPKIPILVFTGLESEQLSIEALKKGAQDYLIKGEINRRLLERSILYSIERISTNERLKTAHHKLEEAQSKVEHSNRLATLGTMATSLTHEIKQPLMAIGLRVERGIEELKSGETEEVLQSFQVILKHVDRIKTIISHLSNYGRITKKKELHPHQITPIIHNAANFLSELLRLDKIQLKLELSDSMSPVLCNPIKIEQVLINLLHNAKDAIEAKDQEGEILIKSFESDSVISIEITDTGCGISKTIIDQIFNPFYTTKDAPEGTGLGLSISHQIIKEHMGKLEVISELGEGSTFRVKLPSAP